MVKQVFQLGAGAVETLCLALPSQQSPGVEDGVGVLLRAPVAAAAGPARWQRL